MKMYKTNRFGSPKIESVEVEKASEKSIWVISPSPFMAGELVRFLRNSVNGDYWDTIEEAKKHLIDTYNKKIFELEKEIEILRIEILKSKLSQINVK